MILAKKSTTIIEVKLDKFDRSEQRVVLEILKACFELHVLGNFWVIALYNSPGHYLNLSGMF